MKKLIFSVLVVALAFSLIACSGSSGAGAAKSLEEVQKILTDNGWTARMMEEQDLSMTTTIKATKGVVAERAEPFGGISYAIMANKDDAVKFLTEGAQEFFGATTEDAKTGLGDEHRQFEAGLPISFVRKGELIVIFMGLDMDETKELGKKLGL